MRKLERRVVGHRGFATTFDLGALAGRVMVHLSKAGIADRIDFGIEEARRV
jgi:hypothetical protein